MKVWKHQVRFQRNLFSGLGLECILGNELIQLHVFCCEIVIRGAIIDLTICNCMRLFICVLLRESMLTHRV